MKEKIQKLISYGEAPVPRDIDMFGTENGDESLDALTEETIGDDSEEDDKQILSYSVGSADDEEIESFQSEEMLEYLKLGWDAKDNVMMADLGMSETEYVDHVNEEMWSLLKDADRALEHEDLKDKSIDFAAGTDGVKRLVGKVATSIQGHVSNETKRRLQQRADYIQDLVSAYEHHKIIVSSETADASEVDQEQLHEIIEAGKEEREDAGASAGAHLQDDTDFNVAEMEGMDYAEEQIAAEESRQRAEKAGVPAGGPSRDSATDEEDEDDAAASAAGDSS